ncbi:hypothetical protein N8Z91_02595 [Ascidiaceihabitans sp.]|nr:hypothetical protein [Ascidiaceihabitans sp.]
MRNDITELNNFCAPIYKVDRSSPDYQTSWNLFVWLGWVTEGRRSDFINHRFNAFCSILHTINANKDYVFHTDLNNASYAVRGWPIGYSPVVETIKHLEALEWIVRHKPTVENQDYNFDLTDPEKPTKPKYGVADRFTVPESSPLRLGNPIRVAPILDKEGRAYFGPVIGLHARSDKERKGRGPLLVEDLNDGWATTKCELKAPLDRINHLIAEHDYQHPDWQSLNDWGELQYKRLFIGSLRRYGRLHNGFQSKSNREQLTIDGSLTAEVDVHASTLQILAGHSETKFTLPNVDDLYQAGRLQNLNREVIKALVQVVLNSRKPLLERKYWPKSVMEDEEKKALIEDEGIPWSTYRDALAHTYPALTKLPDDFGMSLLRVESDIIVQAMLRLLEAGIGCLSVHDCLIVPQNKVAQAEKAFVDAYAMFGSKPPRLKIDYAV